MEKPLDRICANRFEQCLHTSNISLHEGRSVKNASVDVRLGSEIYNRPGFFNLDDSADKLLIADIPLDKPDTFLWKIRDILQITGISKLIEVDHVPTRLGAQ